MKCFSFIKTILIGLLSGLFAVSCSKSEVSPGKCYLTQFSQSIDGINSVVTTISYDNANHVAFMSSSSGGTESADSITTNSQGYVTVDKILNQPNTKTLYVYDQQQNLIQEESFLSSATPDVTLNFTYNSSNQLSLLQQIEKLTGSKRQDSIVYLYAKYSYSSEATKNPSLISFYYGTISGPSNTLHQTIALTYDSQKSIGDLLPGTPDDFTTFATNNVISEVVNGSANSSREFSYQYNSDGYPISKSFKNIEGTHAFINTYTYTCK